VLACATIKAYEYTLKLLQMKNVSSLRKLARSFLLLCTLQLVFIIADGQVQVSGKVTGPNNNGLPGISVTIANSNFGASTNAEGLYGITTNLRPGNYTIQFSGVGFKPQNKPLTIGPGNAVTVDVQLEEDVLMLNDVVVTGTAVATSKRKLTNAVSTVSARFNTVHRRVLTVRYREK
jgi:hypothetical protein